jgi:hypothetical protein
MPWLIKLTFALSLLALVAATTRASAYDMTGDNEDRYAHPP